MSQPQSMIDTHCHLNFQRYDDDRDAVIQRAVENHVTRMIIPAIDAATSRQAVQLAGQYPQIEASAGIHPNDTADFSTGSLREIEEIARESPVVAIGEIGLDYHWDKSPKNKQTEAFEAQLDLARSLELPVIIHNREASDDVIAILEDWARELPPALQGRAGVLHSFSAPAEVAERALAIGFYIGFTGPVTFKKAHDLRQVAQQVPLDRILVETDGPFLTPEPHRGKRNEPAYIPFIVERLAALHQITSQEMAEYTTRNAYRLFDLRAAE